MSVCLFRSYLTISLAMSHSFTHTHSNTCLSSFLLSHHHPSFIKVNLFSVPSLNHFILKMFFLLPFFSKSLHPSCSPDAVSPIQRGVCLKVLVCKVYTHFCLDRRCHVDMCNINVLFNFKYMYKSL